MSEEVDSLDEVLDHKIGAHDRHRFEIKIDVNLPQDGELAYRVETYFFLPRSLGVSPSSYSKDQFYSNVRRYIRFKTPQMGLAKLSDPDVDKSPFVRLQGLLGGILAGDADEKALERAYSELRLLGCMVRAALRDQTWFYRQEVRAAGEEAVRLKALAEGLKGFSEDIRALIRDFRGLRGSFAQAIVPARLREGMSFVDELFSLAIADSLTALLGEIRERPAVCAALNGVEPSLAEIVKQQHLYRASMGYPSVVEKGSDSETLVFRRSVLKKFVSSVLYLNTETSHWEGVSQLFYAAAAGVAMGFTVLIMGLAQGRFALDSMSFAVIAVVTYVFKDRIKDLLKLWLVSGWTRWFSDRQTLIRDPASGDVIGKLKEAFGFVPLSSVPQEVRARRDMDGITGISNDGMPEEVIRYDREVRIYPRRIGKVHERRRDLADILRVNLLPFLESVDDPKVPLDYLNPETGKIERLEGARVYHINVIFRFAARNGSAHEAERYEKIRIVANRKGIRRVETGL